MTNTQIGEIIEWDILNWSKALAFWKEYLPMPGSNTRILALGERNGGLSLWLGLQGFNVICSDFGGPTKRAREIHAGNQVSSLIEYADIDIFKIPYQDNYFDLIICKSVIGGLKGKRNDPATRTLENQKRAIEEIRRVLKLKGTFLGAENTRGSYVHQLARRALKGSKIGWRHLTLAEVKWLFGSYSNLQMIPYGFFGSYYPSKLVNRVFAQFDSFLSRYFPDRWLYLTFIAARK